MLSNVIVEKLSFLKDLVAVGVKADMDLSVKVDEAVNPKFFFHLES